ncbi:uncharacterized protein LOC113309187 isoform X2 [Papaver somniferum]|uniref:uncharacterized protein LOC113309187 isoform X2 n=1 Tax=Papaver somniferum TaxID=3469 RepID=UPI000E701F26|nr:uncharacterized protein LOC113309187 isoform X2 [Papaver somniferum]
MILRDFYQYQSYLLFHFDLNLADDDENLIDFLCSPLQLDRSTINPVYHSRFQHPPPAVTTVNCSSPAMLNNNDNKENFNDQNLSLSEDPQQTKRSTKTWGMQFKEKFSLTKVLVQLTKAPSGSVSPGLRRGSSLIPEKKPNSASSSSSRPYVIRSSKTSARMGKSYQYEFLG